MDDRAMALRGSLGTQSRSSVWPPTVPRHVGCSSLLHRVQPDGGGASRDPNFATRGDLPIGADRVSRDPGWAVNDKDEWARTSSGDRDLTPWRSLFVFSFLLAASSQRAVCVEASVRGNAMRKNCVRCVLLDLATLLLPGCLSTEGTTEGDPPKDFVFSIGPSPPLPGEPGGLRWIGRRGFGAMGRLVRLDASDQ